MPASFSPTRTPTAPRRGAAKAIALFACLILSAGASAQIPATPAAPEPVGRVEPAARPSGRDAYTAATQLVQAGRAAEAVPLLEDLLSSDPASVPVSMALQEAYEATARTDDALRTAEMRIGSVSAAGLVERGSILLRAHRPDEAQVAFDRAVALDPADEQTWRSVADALGAARRFPEAAAVLERGRAAVGRDDAFLFERATLYGLAGDAGAAADLYLAALAQRPDAVAGVRGRLRRLLGAQGAPEAIRAAVERAQTRDPLNRAFRELASFLALERGDYDAALDGIRALDRLDREEGQSLVAFAATAEAAGATDAAQRALDEVLERHPTGASAPQALLARAGYAERRARDAAERAPAPTPRADAARQDYRAFRDQYAGLAGADRAALDLAHLERDVYLDFAASEALLETAADARDPAVAGQARLDLGDVAVRRGALDAARERFQTVDETLGTGPLAEQARFELALLDFYEGYVFSALARVEAIDQNTAADATNDAIALKVTLNENAGEAGSADSTNATLKAYAAASLLVRQGQDARALAALDRLGQAVGDGPLQDEILFLAAQAQRRLGRPRDAVATLDRLAADVPLSFYRDRALVVQADTAEHDLADRDAAMARLASLLQQFPGSLFAPDARERLRTMRANS